MAQGSTQGFLIRFLSPTSTSSASELRHRTSKISSTVAGVSVDKTAANSQVFMRTAGWQ